MDHFDASDLHVSNTIPRRLINVLRDPLCVMSKHIQNWREILLWFSNRLNNSPCKLVENKQILEMTTCSLLCTILKALISNFLRKNHNAIKPIWFETYLVIQLLKIIAGR